MRISIPYLSFFMTVKAHHCEQATYSHIDVMSSDVRYGRVIFIFLRAAAVQHALEPFSPFHFLGGPLHISPPRMRKSCITDVARLCMKKRGLGRLLRTLAGGVFWREKEGGWK